MISVGSLEVLCEDLEPAFASRAAKVSQCTVSTLIEHRCLQLYSHHENSFGVLFRIKGWSNHWHEFQTWSNRMSRGFMSDCPKCHSWNLQTLILWKFYSVVAKQSKKEHLWRCQDFPCTSHYYTSLLTHSLHARGLEQFQDGSHPLQFPQASASSRTGSPCAQQSCRGRKS